MIEELDPDGSQSEGPQRRTAVFDLDEDGPEALAQVGMRVQAV